MVCNLEPKLTTSYTVCRKFDSLYRNLYICIYTFCQNYLVWTLLGVKKKRFNNSFKIQNASIFLNSRTNAVNGT